MTQASPFMFTELPNPISTYFTVEGNIGCGKSTFLKTLKQRIPQLQWIQEPVTQWKSLGTSKTNLLERYYAEPKRWGFTFQIYAIFTRLQKMQQSCNRFPDKIKISQRSILADKFVFSQIMKELQFMSESEYQIFKSLYKSFQRMSPITKAKIIYLRCNPQVCHQRISLRKRPEEEEISIQYLQMLHNKHQKWIDAYDPTEILILDTTEDFSNNEKVLAEMVQKLVNFIKIGYE